MTTPMIAPSLLPSSELLPLLLDWNALPPLVAAGQVVAAALSLIWSQDSAQVYTGDGGVRARMEC